MRQGNDSVFQVIYACAPGRSRDMTIGSNPSGWINSEKKTCMTTISLRYLML